MLRAGVALGVLAALSIAAQTPAEAGYADPSACAECHAAIAESYARTPMAQSFRAARAGVILPEFDGGSFSHAVSGERFIPARRGDRYVVRRDGPAGTASYDAPVDYVLGSGAHARSYLHRTRDGRLVEFPVTWYAENGGHWGMSPGYDRAGHQGFSREINYRCMFCHNGYPEIDSRAAEWSGGSIYPKRLPEGIDCQRCHGPGRRHVEAAGRAPIVNPARLSPDRRLEVCLQCHLEPTSAPLPSAILRFGRSAFSYRAGEPLGDFLVFFDHAPGAGYEDKFEIVGAAYRFRKSACYLQSGGRILCDTCHDPHRASSHAETVTRTERACGNCHRTVAVHAASRSCVGCHMPQRPAEDVVHVAITDHWIRKQPAPVKAEAREAITPPYAGEVALYYPPELADTPDNELLLAVAQVKDLANLPAGLARLESLLARLQPQGARPYFEMGEALRGIGQPSRAAPYFEAAVRRDPQNWRYRLGLARASGSAEAYERACSLSSNDAAVLLAIGSAASLRQAIDRNPENAAAHAALANVLLRSGGLDGAERAFRESVRLAPEISATHIALAGVLIARGKPDEAKQALQLALRAGPSIEAAQSAWFSTLAETGDRAAALVSYDSSLHAQLAPARVNLGTALMIQGDAEGALREYRSAVQADPESGAALVNLALALMRRGDAVEARNILENAVRANPGLLEAHLRLGELLVASGETASAREHLRRASESPDPRIRRAAAEAIAEIQK